MADFFDVLGGIGSGLAGVSSISQTLGNMFSSRDGDVNSVYEKQKMLMDQNNKFQSEENQKSRDFTSEMYKKQWSDLTSWNDYKNVVSRALAAGISPSAIFSSGAPSQLGGVSPASVGHSASPSPSYGDIVNPVNRQAESFHSISSGLKSLVDLAKTGVETQQIGSLMKAQIQNQLSEAGFNDIRSKSADFELGLRQIYGKKLYDSELGKNAAQMVNAYAQAYLSAEEGNTQESVRELNKAERLYKDMLRGSTDKQIEMMNLQMQWYPKEMRARINNLNTESYKNAAQASEASASAEQTRLFNRIYSDKRYQHSIISQAVTAGQQAIDANKMTKQQVQHMNYMIEQAAYANDMKEFTYWSNQINGFVGTLGQAASQFYGAGALRELIKLRQLQGQPPTRVRGFGQ